jgi:carotenoid cleavage dioxygenase-like enzyme
MPNKSSFSYGAGFRSLTREIADPVALKVDGTLPSWLEGTLLRTGPSKFEVGSRSYNLWFDGLAMLHRFAFADGGVSYANRLLKSKAFCAAEASGKIAFGEFATDPCWTLFGRVAAIFNPKLTDNCCVNVADYARAAVAFTETSIPVRFSPDTLETLGVFTAIISGRDRDPSWQTAADALFQTNTIPVTCDQAGMRRPGVGAPGETVGRIGPC